MIIANNILRNNIFSIKFSSKKSGKQNTNV